MNNSYYYCHKCETEVVPSYSEHCTTCGNPVEIVEKTSWRERAEKAEDKLKASKNGIRR